jgi:hypothetical protein
MYQYVEDGGDLVNYMASYFQYYAIGMGTGKVAS